MKIEKIHEAEGAPRREVVRSQRYTKEQWAEVESAAKKAGMTAARFIRGCTLSQAREILKK